MQCECECECECEVLSDRAIPLVTHTRHFRSGFPASRPARPARRADTRPDRRSAPTSAAARDTARRSRVWPPLRSTIDAAPTTVAPASLATSIVSRVEPPVVTTSSTTRTRSRGRQREAAPERQPSVLALGEDRPDAQRAAHFVADDDAAERGRQDDGRPEVPAPAAPAPRRARRHWPGSTAPARTAGSGGCAGRT